MNDYHDARCFKCMCPEHQETLQTLIATYSGELDTGPLLPELAYTQHNFTDHCQNIYRYISTILITGEGFEKLSSSDLFKLNAAVLFHDLSMSKTGCARERHGEESAELLKDPDGGYYKHLRKFVDDEALGEICVMIRAHTDDKSVKPPQKTLRAVCEDPDIRPEIKIMAGILRLADELDMTSSRVDFGKYEELKGLARDNERCRDSLRHWERCMGVQSVQLRSGYTNCILVQVNDGFREACPHYLELLRECRKKLMGEFEQFNACIYDKLPLARSITANWNRVYFKSDKTPDIDSLVSAEQKPDAEPPPPPEPLEGMIALSYSEKGKDKDRSGLKTEDLLDELTRSRYVALLGPSGAGKTVSLRQIRQAAEGRFGTVVTFELARYINQNGDQIAREVEEALRRQSRSGRNGILLLLDGLNEVPVQYQTECNQELDRLVASKQYSIFLTSRPYGTFPSCYAHFKRYDVDPLDEGRILEIAETQLSERFDRFQDSYQDLPLSIQKSMRTPMFLVMCITLFQQQGRIPAKRSVIYHDYFELLFQRDRGVAGAAPAELKHLAAQKIAFWMQEESLVMSCWDGQAILAEHRRECIDQGLYAEQDYPPASTLLKALLGSTVLVLVGTEYFRFYHESYQEYYAARELSEQLARDYAKYRLYLSNRRWAEVVKYLAGIFPDSARVVDELIPDDVEDSQLELALEIAYQEDFAPELRARIFRKIEKNAFSWDFEKQKSALSALEYIKNRAGLSEQEIQLLTNMKSRMERKHTPVNIRFRIDTLLSCAAHGEE